MSEHRGLEKATAVHRSEMRDDRINQAVAEFLKAAEQGGDFDLQAIMSRYADVADELAGCIETFDFMHNVAPQFAEVAAPASATKGGKSIAPLATLGDFRIEREIGRGGMGVVYEATQLSLGRRVAMKVLPFAAMLDRQQIKRFKNEARAAATLDHPNIVAVHSVGEERGVHYYAMQLVEGHSLAQVITQLRAGQASLVGDAVPRPTHNAGTAVDSAANQSELASPSANTRRDPQAAVSTFSSFHSREYFRQVARLIAQAATALDHAHQAGVLHRDVKPGNLLVDADGKLLVTDFGLARVEGDGPITMTGDLLVRLFDLY